MSARRLYIGPAGPYSALACGKCGRPRRADETFCTACEVDRWLRDDARPRRAKDWGGAIAMAAFLGVVIGVFVAAMIVPIAGVIWLLGR